MPINKEKQDIIKTEGNILVTANPGTGKTLLIAHKYADLINKKVPPEQILCLTFTEKAKREMEERILDILKEKKVVVDLSKINVRTFHSYALNNIEENEVITSNLLRYSIYRYLKDNDILNYSDEYLIETIVPKIENLIRYLKSFGITPDKIETEKAKSNLEPDARYTEEELEKFVENFVDIFKHYECIKSRKGVDYADLLIKFLELRCCPNFEYVFIDELQDVNKMEANIALKSGKAFFIVGDKKQAIFGFQGGSILNFKLFKAKEEVLSENYRSTDQILSYAKDYLTARTKDEEIKKELKDLHNAEGKKGPKPTIYRVSKELVNAAACDLAEKMNCKVAIIARTNNQISYMAKELRARGIDFSTTFFSSSNEAKNKKC